MPGLEFPVAKKAAGPGSYFSQLSPETFTFYWRFRTLLAGKTFGYKFIAWEPMDGHRCAHIEFSANPSSGGRVSQELWVDLSRGAHPLKIRNSDGNTTVYEVDQIVLKDSELPSGEIVWFPVHGRFSRYHHHGQYTKDPTFQTTTYVLDGTLVFNQGLKDDVFHVKGESFRPSFRPRNPAVAQRPKRTTPDDFETAEKALDAALADPARTALEPDASGSARQEFGTPRALVWGLGLGGAAALTIAAWLAWRSRRAP